MVTRIAAVDIPYGVLVEEITSGATAGQIQPVQDTGTAGSFTPRVVGVSMLDPMREQTFVPDALTGSTPRPYKAGEAVPVARRGSVFVQWDGGGTWGSLVKPNVWHSSDGTHSQGVFTFTGTATTAGAEIDNAPSGILAIRPQWASNVTTNFGTAGVAVVELNFAG